MPFDDKADFSSMCRLLSGIVGFWCRDPRHVFSLNLFCGFLQFKKLLQFGVSQ